MRFAKPESKELNDFTKEVIKEEDQTGIEETRQPEEAKLITWESGTSTTLVNIRKDPSPNAPILGTIRGGEVFRISSSLFDNFYKVGYKNLEGYVNKNYIRRVTK